jgi:Integrase core domain
MLNLIDEYTRECLAIHVRRRINSINVIEVLADAMIEHGIPEYIRSDNGPEFVTKELRKWLARTGASTLYIEPESPWENGYCESFNSKLRDEFLNGEIFYSLKEVQVLAERWRIYYNTERPHSSLGYRPPAPRALQPGDRARRPAASESSGRKVSSTPNLRRRCPRRCCHSLGCLCTPHCWHKSCWCSSSRSTDSRECTSEQWRNRAERRWWCSARRWQMNLIARRNRCRPRQRCTDYDHDRTSIEHRARSRSGKTLPDPIRRTSSALSPTHDFASSVRLNWTGQIVVAIPN